MESALKSIVVLIMMFTIQSCASTGSEPLAQLNGCWQFNTGEVADVSNTMSLCISENSASMNINYPNKGDIPTKCSQSGFVRKNKNATILVSLETGDCENGRELSALNLICGSESPLLRCVSVGGGPHMKFDKIAHNKLFNKDKV